MNKLSLLLLVTAVTCVNLAHAGYGKSRMQAGMHKRWENKTEEWRNAIKNTKDPKIKADAKQLLKKIEKEHDKIDRLREKKHKNMNELDKKLGLKTTEEKIRTKVAQVKNKLEAKKEAAITKLNAMKNAGKPMMVVEEEVAVAQMPVMAKAS